MGIKEKVKRRYFTKAQKVSILNEMSLSGLSVYRSWLGSIKSALLFCINGGKKMDIDQERVELVPKYQSVVSELEKTKQENEYLKKALSELAVEKQILKTANEILKKTEKIFRI